MDGKLLACTSLNGQASVWDVSDNPPRLLHQWRAADWGTSSIAFSADAKALLIAALGTNVRLWNISNPSFPSELPSFPGTSGPGGFTGDRRSVVAADAGAHFLRAWDYEPRRELPRWPERPATFVSLAFSPDARTVASGLADGEIVVWDMEGKSEPLPLMGHEQLVTALGFSRNGQLLVSGSLDKTVRLWDVAQMDPSERVVAHGYSGAGLCFSPDSRYLASLARTRTPEPDGSVRDQHTVKLWDVKSMRELTSAPTGGNSWTSHPAFTPDGRFFVSDSTGSMLKYFRVPSLELAIPLHGSSPSFAPPSETLVYASGRRIVQRRAPASSDAVETTIGELASSVFTLALSPNGRTVACSGEEDGGTRIQFWDVQQHRCLGSVTNHQGQVCQMAFSPKTGERLASVAWDGKVGIWDVASRRLIKLLSGHTGDLYGVAFSPDGLTIASCGEDTVRLWSATTLDQVAVLRKMRFAAVSFSPDGQWLAAAAQNGSVHVWHAPLWEELETSAFLSGGRP
jgi:WD40 repeat protein